MSCYFQGCHNKGTTKEHIPPKAFFPEGERNQLLTVKSCEDHNNAKSKHDLYVLAHICLTASPKNRAREVFLKKVIPQLSFNENSMRKMLLKDASPLPNGAVKYKVDVSRLDFFFTALTCGILFKSCGKVLPGNYSIGHIYHDFIDESDTEEFRRYKQGLLDFYSDDPSDFMKFGHVGTENTSIYSVKIFGVPNYQGSITVIHEFFGSFKVFSMVKFMVYWDAANKALQRTSR